MKMKHTAEFKNTHGETLTVTHEDNVLTLHIQDDRGKDVLYQFEPGQNKEFRDWVNWTVRPPV